MARLRLLLSFVFLTFCVTAAFAAYNPEQFMREISKEMGGKRYYLASQYSGAGADKLQAVMSAFQPRGYFRNYPVYVIESSDWNAFATAGGCSPDLICLLTGLLTEVKSSDELAAVIAHELVHNYKQHGSKQQNASLLAVLIGAVLLPEKSKSNADVFAGMMAMGFSRDQEAEADRDGLFLLTEAGFQPTAAVDLWQRIAKKHGSGTRIFMDHPPSTTRAKDLNRIVQKNLRQNPNGTWTILSRKTKSTGQAMNARYKNAIGAGMVATGTYVVVEANRYDWDFSRFRGNDMWRDAGMWCGAGMVFGFLMPSDFIFFQKSLRNPTGNPPTGIRGKPMIGIGTDQSYRVGLAVKF